MRTVAAILFPDFEMLDLYGPLELFSYYRDDFEIRTVAAQTGPVKSSGGRGVRSVLNDATLLAWLKNQSKRAEYSTSVCTGSLLLANAGILQGRPATTNKLAFDWVDAQTNGVDWKRSARWVQDGSVYTSSGVSAGMDMALAVIEDCLGPKAAEDAAINAEFIRNPDPDNDPFAAIGETR